MIILRLLALGLLIMTTSTGHSLEIACEGMGINGVSIKRLDSDSKTVDLQDQIAIFQAVIADAQHVEYLYEWTLVSLDEPTTVFVYKNSKFIFKPKLTGKYDIILRVQNPSNDCGYHRMKFGVTSNAPFLGVTEVPVIGPEEFKQFDHLVALNAQKLWQ
ncbi:MAG: hypothetical protein HN730_06855, partial [Bdellovibrionales bacterium]|nr:hypothetical protein [Bdellovibrionales bacterium]